MPQETTTATKNPWVILSAQTSRHSIGGKVAVEPCSTAPLPAPSTVAPPAFPGLALAIPLEVSNQIDAMALSCRWRSHPQHQQRTRAPQQRKSENFALSI